MCGSAALIIILNINKYYMIIIITLFCSHCSQWRPSSQRAPNRRKLLKRPGQLRRLIVIV